MTSRSLNLNVDTPAALRQLWLTELSHRFVSIDLAKPLLLRAPVKVCLSVPGSASTLELPGTVIDCVRMRSDSYRVQVELTNLPSVHVARIKKLARLSS